MFLCWMTVGTGGSIAAVANAEGGRFVEDSEGDAGVGRERGPGATVAARGGSGTGVSWAGRPLHRGSSVNGGLRGRKRLHLG